MVLCISKCLSYPNCLPLVEYAASVGERNVSNTYLFDKSLFVQMYVLKLKINVMNIINFINKNCWRIYVQFICQKLINPYFFKKQKSVTCCLAVLTVVASIPSPGVIPPHPSLVIWVKVALRRRGCFLDPWGKMKE